MDSVKDNYTYLHADLLIFTQFDHHCHCEYFKNDNISNLLIFVKNRHLKPEKTVYLHSTVHKQVYMNYSVQVHQ